MSIIRRPQPTAGAARPRKGAVPEAAAMPGAVSEGLRIFPQIPN